MIIDYEREQYRQMIRESRWDELAEVMDRKLQRCILAMNSQVIAYEELHTEVQRVCREVLDEVLDPRGGSLGYVYDFSEAAWEQLQTDYSRWLTMNGNAESSSEKERFFRAMDICHIPLSLLAVMPECIARPLPASSSIVWVAGGEEVRSSIAAGGYEGMILGENGVEAHLEITGPAVPGNHPSAGNYVSYEAMGYVTGYTTPAVRPLAVQIYDAYPDDIMIRYQQQPMDEYAYRRHWQAYFRWQEDMENRIRSEIDCELGKVSGKMRAGAPEDRYGNYDERSYGGNSYGNSGYGWNS